MHVNYVRRYDERNADSATVQYEGQSDSVKVVGDYAKSRTDDHIYVSLIARVLNWQAVNYYSDVRPEIYDFRFLAASDSVAALTSHAIARDYAEYVATLEQTEFDGIYAMSDIMHENRRYSETGKNAYVMMIVRLDQSV